MVGGEERLVDTKKWELSTETGTSSTTWATMPTPVRIEITPNRTTAIQIVASVSRCQHDTENANTAYRIVVDAGTSRENIVQFTNLGNHHGWAYKSLNMHAITTVTPGFHCIQLEYKTQRGTEIWYSDDNGYQFRSISVLEL